MIINLRQSIIIWKILVEQENSDLTILNSRNNFNLNGLNRSQSEQQYVHMWRSVVQQWKHENNVCFPERNKKKMIGKTGMMMTWNVKNWYFIKSRSLSCTAGVVIVIEMQWEWYQLAAASMNKLRWVINEADPVFYSTSTTSALALNPLTIPHTQSTFFALQSAKLFLLFKVKLFVYDLRFSVHLPSVIDSYQATFRIW